VGSVPEGGCRCVYKGQLGKGGAGAGAGAGAELPLEVPGLPAGRNFPLPALRRQPPGAAVGQGVGWEPRGSLPGPAHLGPICEAKKTSPRAANEKDLQQSSTGRVEEYTRDLKRN
jgi:hypothetical protein